MGTLMALIGTRMHAAQNVYPCAASHAVSSAFDPVVALCGTRRYHPSIQSKGSKKSMRVAEALIKRADYQKRLDQLRIRLNQNVKVQEGDQPAENPMVLLDEIERISGEQQTLIQRINRTNSATMLSPGELSIADAIAERDILRLRHSVYTTAIAAAVIKQDRYSKSEIRFQSTVDVGALQQVADDLARQYRELDTRIQESNWQTELI
jgi:hypothetical protein